MTTVRELNSLETKNRVNFNDTRACVFTTMSSSKLVLTLVLIRVEIEYYCYLLAHCALHTVCYLNRHVEINEIRKRTF